MCLHVCISICKVQQQILNLFAAFLTSGQKSAKALQRSKIVMDFLKQLIDSKNETIDAEKMDKRNEVSPFRCNKDWINCNLFAI